MTHKRLLATLRMNRVVQRGRVVKGRRLVLMRAGCFLSKLNRALSLGRGADLGLVSIESSRGV